MLCDQNKFWTALRLMLQLVQNRSSSYVCLQFLLPSLSHGSGPLYVDSGSTQSTLGLSKPLLLLRKGPDRSRICL